MCIFILNKLKEVLGFKFFSPPDSECIVINIASFKKKSAGLKKLRYLSMLSFKFFFRNQVKGDIARNMPLTCTTRLGRTFDVPMYIFFSTLPPPLYITDSVGTCIIIALKAKGYSEYLGGE